MVVGESYLSKRLLISCQRHEKVIGITISYIKLKSRPQGVNSDEYLVKHPIFCLWQNEKKLPDRLMVFIVTPFLWNECSNQCFSYTIVGAKYTMFCWTADRTCCCTHDTVQIDFCLVWHSVSLQWCQKAASGHPEKGLRESL